MPNRRSRIPTTCCRRARRTEPSATPKTATSSASNTSAPNVPRSAERHPRTTPTARTTVSASTASTEEARNALAMVDQACIETLIAAAPRIDSSAARCAPSAEGGWSTGAGHAARAHSSLAPRTVRRHHARRARRAPYRFGCRRVRCETAATSPSPSAKATLEAASSERARPVSSSAAAKSMTTNDKPSRTPARKRARASGSSAVRRRLQAAARATAAGGMAPIFRTSSPACAVAEASADFTASSPNATPSTRTTSTSVNPMKPSTVRRYGS